MVCLQVKKQAEEAAAAKVAAEEAAAEKAASDARSVIPFPSPLESFCTCLVHNRHGRVVERMSLLLASNALTC